MIVDNIKQNPTDEVEPDYEAELNDEKLGEVSGGVGIGPFSEYKPPRMPKNSEEPKDGGATGSW